MTSTDASSSLPLFQRFPRLAEAVAWHPIGDWPTPVAAAERFAGAHHLASLYVKREDLSHPACGGNKVRGLEFLLGDAVRRDIHTLVVFGAAGSHHICKTAWHARQLGIDTVAVILPQPEADYVRRNLAAGRAAGVTYIPAHVATLAPKLAWQCLKLRASANKQGMMLVPSGGTSALSCLGHVNAALELKRQIDAEQLPTPDTIFLALGSLGMAAGLALGCQLAGLPTRIVGVTVSYRWYCTARRWARFARRTWRLMRRLDPSVPEVNIDPARLTVVHSALGDGYARPTPQGQALARQFESLEGIRLDPTYTAKTLAGAMQYIRANSLENAAHLFWQSYHEMP